MDHVWRNKHINLMEIAAIEGGTETKDVAMKTREICPLLAAEVLVQKNKIEEAIAAIEKATESWKMKRKSRDTDYTTPLVCLCLQNRDRKKALRVVERHIGERAAVHPWFCKLKVLIEGHIYHSTRNEERAAKWVESAKAYLSVFLDYDVFLLCVKMKEEILKEPKEEAENELIGTMGLNDARYIDSAEELRHIKSFEKVLRRKGLSTEMCERVLLIRNPLVKKSEVIEYFEKYQNDRETLTYILERRNIKELAGLAKKLGVETDAVKNQQLNFRWMIERDRRGG